MSHLALGAAVLAGLMACGSCKRTADGPDPGSAPVTLRLVALSTLAGALEPCGCQKDMLGGIDHAATLTSGSSPLVVAAGPTFFMDPELSRNKRNQDLWKAEAIATSLADMKLAAWTPGHNDWAAGAEDFAALVKKAGAPVLGANLEAATKTQSVHVVEKDGFKVGIAGVSRPAHQGVLPKGVEASDPKSALRAAKKELVAKKAEVFVALVALPRGEALRLAEAVPGFHVMVVGKPSDQGEGNDGPIPAARVGSTLVVQPPNHLQAVSVVDLHIRAKPGAATRIEFADGSGLEVVEKRTSLERRIRELEARLERWKTGGKVDPKDVSAREADLAKMKKELAGLKEPEPPTTGSFFKYALELVRERVGTDDAVSKRMASYYKRVNDHNAKAFADLKPPPVGANESGYIGIEECSGCHTEAYDFWKKTGHARAYETLSKQHKEFNLDCVKCHVTGYGKPGGSTVTFVSELKDVQCETCHGPGSRHADDNENPDYIIAKPKKDLCAPLCHHPPHVGEDWSVDEAWKHIIGPGHGEPSD